MFWILFLYVSFEYVIYLPAVYLTCHGLQLWNMDLFIDATPRQTVKLHLEDIRTIFDLHLGMANGAGEKHMEKTWDTFFFFAHVLYISAVVQDFFDQM